MLEQQILLTTPTYPYPTLPANDSLTDATGQRFTKGDDVFTIISHTHCFANHILAQNIDVPAVLLEYPRWDDFTREVDRGYPLIGISSYPVHLKRVMEMCEYIRKRSPATRIMLGSYAAMAFKAQYDAETRRKYVDHLVLGEGVRYVRKLLGEKTSGRPVQQRLMPKAGGSPPFINKYPIGCIGFLVSGLGCIGGCDFCSSTALFDKKRIQLLSPEELVQHINLYYEQFPDLTQVFVIEEDHFRYPRYLHRMRKYWHDSPHVLERLDWFAFGSIDHIGKFAREYGWEALAETGIGCIFIGVESKFAGEHGYDKRAEFDAREVFDRLHSMGIRTVGAWMCGWDFHDHTNIHEDLNYYVSLYPTYQQLTRVSPFPGTDLWAKLRKENRVRDVPWEDVHFWNNSQKNVVLEAHETLNLTEYGYNLLYTTWGPSLLRRLDVQLNGYAYCRKSSNTLLRRHKAKFFKRQCAMLWTVLAGMDRFAPNGVVRRRVRKVDEKFRRLIGQPTPTMVALSKALESASTIARFMELVDPLNRHPKEEPFKRYTYRKNGNTHHVVPYETEWLSKNDWLTQLDMQRTRTQTTVLAQLLKAVKAIGFRKGDPFVDDYLVELIERGGLGFGF